MNHERIELVARGQTSTLQAFSERLFEIERENGFLRTDRLPLSPDTAYVIDVPLPVPAGKARGQQPSTMRARDQTLESGFDRESGFWCGSVGVSYWLAATTREKPGPGARRGYEGGRTNSVSTGLARLLRLLRNARSADWPDPLGPLAASGCFVAAMENPTPSSSSSVGTRGPPKAGEQHRWQRTWPLVSRTRQSPLCWALQCLLRIAWSSFVR